MASDDLLVTDEASRIAWEPLSWAAFSLANTILLSLISLTACAISKRLFSVSEDWTIKMKSSNVSILWNWMNGSYHSRFRFAATRQLCKPLSSCITSIFIARDMVATKVVAPDSAKTLQGGSLTMLVPTEGHGPMLRWKEPLEWPQSERLHLYKGEGGNKGEPKPSLAENWHQN